MYSTWHFISGAVLLLPATELLLAVGSRAAVLLEGGCRAVLLLHIRFQSCVASTVCPTVELCSRTACLLPPCCCTGSTVRCCSVEDARAVSLLHHSSILYSCATAQWVLELCLRRCSRLYGRTAAQKAVKPCCFSADSGPSYIPEQ